MDTSKEFLVVRGSLDHAGHFELRRSRSTAFVRRWPRSLYPGVFIELLDQGRMLHREPVEGIEKVVCTPRIPAEWNLRGVIQLRPDAKEVRIVIEQRTLWTRRIPPAPKLRIASRGTQRGKEVTVDVRFSEAADDAHLTLIYQWKERGFRTVYLGPPKESITLDLQNMPGGPECRILATYSNGLRSAQAVTRFFSMPRLGPELYILSPQRAARVTAGAPLALQGAIRDDEREGGPAFDDLVWLLDGELVSRGLIASTPPLKPGRHALALEYRPATETRSSASVSATVTVTAVPAGDASAANDWPEWDFVLGAAVASEGAGEDSRPGTARH